MGEMKWRKNYWKFEVYVRSYPEQWSKDWFKVYWATFPGIITVLGLIIASVFEWITWMNEGFALFLFVSFGLLGLMWVRNYRQWKKREILAYMSQHFGELLTDLENDILNDN